MNLKRCLSPSHTCCRVSGDGCGHTVQGSESGTLASQNYPGTYPSNTWCRWRLRVPEGRTLRLLFGDFDVESSPACSNGSMVITDKNGELILGEPPRCACKSDWWRGLNPGESSLKYVLVPLCQWRWLTHAHRQHAIPLTDRPKRQTLFCNQVQFRCVLKALRKNKKYPAILPIVVVNDILRKPWWLWSGLVFLSGKCSYM